ncbi:hypothetical protein [Tateyamaria pelophila]|uniref:hypothetical protein n=1 Tax=Tateyamaria pelophila TaxID=328415 RepID=UPI001CBEAB17|nr:hypothetical protein [Tateyamaria pelophila]
MGWSIMGAQRKTLAFDVRPDQVDSQLSGIQTLPKPTPFMLGLHETCPWSEPRL